MDRDDLVEAACNGDPDARDEIANWLFEEFDAYFSGRFPAHEVDDLVQKTIVDVLRKLGTHAPRGDVAAFRDWAMSFAGMMARRTRGERKREAWRRTRLSRRVMTPLRSPTSSLIAHQRAERLRACVARLPEIYREAMEHELAGGSNRELAELAGISDGAARVRRFKARQLLREMLEAVERTPAPALEVGSPASPGMS